ncbi:MAG: V-type ATP synthase subunit B [Vicinamibacterales bacterium]
MTAIAGMEYVGLKGLRGPLAFIDAVPGLAFHDEVELTGADGRSRTGRVLGISEHAAVVEIFGATDGLTLSSTSLRFEGSPLRLGVSRELLGRSFDGLGRPRDGLPPPLVGERRPIEGVVINPCRREYPRDFLETGISAIDLLTSVVLGQKLPIFTEAGLPHDALALQIVRQARAPGVEAFAIVFAALGLPRAVALRYEEAFRATGAFGRMVAFMNLADDPPAERLITPRCALTAAEYLAFDCGMHVLVVLNDITNYGESLREVSAARGEVPSRKGYPGYLYSDLASIFERAGRIKGRPGSLTQIPIVTMPSGDVTHPIPDLTGYVTEGQIILDRALDRRGVYPPIAVLPSLSRLMGDGIGAGRTREDHEDVARQLYAACARVERARSLESIIGRDELSEAERRYLRFGERFEASFLRQAPDESRPIADTLAKAWQLFAGLPSSDLTRLSPALVARYLPAPAGPPAPVEKTP